jgi:hypothetical protein
MLLVSAATLQPLPIPKQICIGLGRGLSKVDALNYGPGSMVQRALLFYRETAASVCMWHRVCFQFLALRVALNTGAIQGSGRKGKP